MADASQLDLTARRPWQRYRAPLVAVVPLGFAVGAITGLAFWLNSLALGIGPTLGYMLLVYGTIGTGFAAVAALGAIAGVLTATTARDDTSPPFARISCGAAAAVFAGVLIASAASAIATGSWEWYWVSCWIAVFAGLVSGACAAAITAFFQYRTRILP